jgi:hypothetical protein
MSDPKPTIHQYDCLTGETITRELTPEEIALLPQATDETPTAG